MDILRTYTKQIHHDAYRYLLFWVAPDALMPWLFKRMPSHVSKFTDMMPQTLANTLEIHVEIRVS